MRHAPLSNTRPQDEPGFNLLHHLCQAYVDYLTASTEEEKQHILYDVAGFHSLCFRTGAEGEEILDLLVAAVVKRGRVYVDQDHWIEVDGKAIRTMVSRRWLNRERAMLNAANAPDEELSCEDRSALIEKIMATPLSDYEYQA
jgi:hypothetical protein